MAKMTRYKRPGIQVAQPQNIDFAGLRESARMGQVISRQVDKMSSFLEKRAQEEAEFKAGEIIREKGSAAATDIRAAGGPKTYMEKQVYESGMRIASSELETNALGEINRVMFEAETKHLSPTQLRQNLEEISDGFPAALSDLDGNAAGMLRSKLQGHIAEAETKYMGIHSKYVLQQEQGRALLGLDAREKAALDAVTLPVDKETRSAAFEAHIAETAQFLRDKQYSEEYISKWIIKTKEQGTVDSSLADFSRLPSMEAKVKYLENLEKNPPKNLTREKARSLISALRTDMTNTQKLYKAEVKSIDGSITEMGKVLKKGGLPSEEDLNKIELRVNGLPEEAQGQLAQDLASLRFKRGMLSSYRKQTPEDLQNEINRISEGIENIGGSGVDTLLEAELLEDAKSLLSNMNTELTKDPLSHAHLVDNAKVEPIPLDSIFAGLTGSPDALGEAEEAISNRRATAHTVKNFYDSELRFFTNEEAEKIKNIYDNGDANQKSVVLHGINKLFGADAGKVFNELSNIDPVMGHVGGLLDIGLKENARVALLGFERLADKPPMDFDATMAKEAFDTYTGRSFLLQSKLESSTFETAKAIYTQKSAERNITTYDQTLWEQSINMAVGFNPQNGTGGIGQINDSTIVMPPGFTEDSINEMLENITLEQIEYQNPGVEISLGNHKSINDNDDIKLMTLRDGIYVPYVETATGEPRYFMDGKRNLIQLDIEIYQGQK